ncbi:MAG: methylenetetrahydrofolate--tRNA-(uracil(54)-C(5))-methyltransferase (FADH(2)-oxidizing) TrmFO [Xanthomonadaceae bacterium]|nr:methylenetetrahydrofolate--tRNA-(uracil(54)-C(5))-methyltransferase (FADH(2)-oxidizing) TrmFO [Xanthomonadaceae bacterium]
MGKKNIHIVGSGLAGSEAAFWLAEHGIHVEIHEMRPIKMTEAHHSGECAELVCSNSLKSKSPSSAPGMLKAEMIRMGSLILKSAEDSAVAGGEALTVDRVQFSKYITEKLKNHPNITFVNEEVSAPEFGAPTIIATGPLTSDSLSSWIAKSTGEGDLYFYDAIAPIVSADSIDPEKSFLANRYDKGGESAYINCPMNKEEYEAFIDALIAAEKVPPKNFEKENFFQGCQPIEAIAAGGRESLRFGPMKPVGLTDPKTGRRPWACVQLRSENIAKTAYNIVGFQTKLKYSEQSRVFKMIPALKNVEFLRLGSIHRNTYVCGPKVLNPDLSLKSRSNIFLAGQITGVEGYVESSACGLLAAFFAYQRVMGAAYTPPPLNTALGALLSHITGSEPNYYQPSNIHFGLFNPILFTGVTGLKRDDLRQKMSEQTIENFGQWWTTQDSVIAPSAKQ